MKNLVIYVMDSDYGTLKSCETFLYQQNPKSELRFFTTAKLLRKGIKGKPPDVIFAEADEIPPGSLMRDLREFAPTAKVIFVSASGYSAQEALNAGAAGYLTKPVTKEKLQRELERLEHPLLARMKEICKI